MAHSTRWPIWLSVERAPGSLVLKPGETQTPQNKSGDEKEILPHSSDLGEGEFPDRPAKSNSCGLLADASGIFAGSCIDGYLFTNGDERRNGNNQAGFAGGGFVLRRGGGTL